MFELIAKCTTYEAALKTIFVKHKSEIYARHLLAIWKQHQGESVDQYVQTLKLLAKDGNLKPVTAEEH